VRHHFTGQTVQNNKSEAYASARARRCASFSYSETTLAETTATDERAAKTPNNAKQYLGENGKT
jgi:hypothetical protein